MSIAEVIDRNDVAALKMFSECTINELINFQRDAAAYPIYYAVERNRPDCVRALIDMNVDIDAHTTYRYTSSNKAIVVNHMECFMILLNAGADIEKTNKELSQNPLNNAIRYRHEDMALILIDRGANTSSIDFTDPKIHYISKFITTRLETRHTALVIFTMHKQKRGPSCFTKQDKHVIKMISKHIWSMRFRVAT
jgi:hypothetical protein